jgi:hypothetical protein
MLAPASGSIRRTISSVSGVGRLPIPIRGGLCRITRTSVAFAASSLPARKKKGTSDQRQFSIPSLSAMKVSVSELGSTPSISR